jgi:uncharacterized membrane protein
MSATIVILLLWVGFAGSHIALSSAPIRGPLVASVGNARFRALYALLALAFFVPLVWTYFTHKHAGPWLWALSRGTPLHWVTYAGMLIAFTLLVASLVRPSPAGLVPGDPMPAGVYRITRHPSFMAFAIFGLIHLLPNGSTADVVFFGGFVLFALIGGWHQDQRKLASGDPGFRAFYAATPFLPFTGNATLQGLRELHPVVIAASIALTLVVRYFHAGWFGG